MSDEKNNIKQKVAVVTGSTAGIGKAIAFSLAEMGYNIIITGRRDKGKVKDLLDELNHLSYDSGECFYIQGDIGERETRNKIVSEIKSKFGFCSVLVNNAGVATKGRKDILEIEEDDMKALLQVNLVAPFMLTSAMVPYMKSNDNRSYVINISSISSYTVSTGRADYCISKAGMSMMTQQFAARLAEDEIGVFEIRPGIIKTDMTSAVQDKYDKLIANDLLPIARWGMPEDIAGVVKVIVENSFPYSTGQVFDIDGGFHIRRL